MLYWQNKKWLENEYIINKRTMQDIGASVQANSGSIFYWIKKFGIPTRKNYNEQTARFDLLNDKNWMCDQHLNKRVSIKTIAALTGVSYKTARKKLIALGIDLNKPHVTLTKPIHQGKRGSDNPRWKGGKSACADCGVLLAARYKKEDPRCAACRKLFYRGERHHSWIPDKTPRSLTNAVRRSAQYRDWRESVYTRDCYTCVICGVRGGNLHAHHLNSFSEFPELRFNTENGVTLCEADHLAFHRHYGMGGNTADQFSEFAADHTIFEEHH